MRRWAVALFAAAACGCIDFGSDFRECVKGSRCDGGPNEPSGTDAGIGDGGGDGGASADGGSFAVDCDTTSGWCWENPFPQGNTLFAVAVLGPDDVWVAGNTGTLLSWDGGTWQSHRNSFSRQPFLSLWGDSPSNLYAVGGSDLCHWDGFSWSINRLTMNDSYGSVYGNDAGEVWVLGGRQAVPWNGSSFGAPVSSGTPGVAAKAIASRGPGDWWTVGSVPAHLDAGAFEPGPPFRFGPDGGTTDQYALWVGPGGEMVSTGWQGSLFMLDGGDGPFREVPLNAPGTFSGLWGTAANNLWLVGTSHGPAHYTGTPTPTEESVTWPLQPGDWERLNAIHGFGSDGGNVWAVGTGGATIRRATPSSWAFMTGGTMKDLRALAFDGQHPYAFGSDGAALKRSDRGWVQDAKFTFSDSFFGAWGGGGQLVAVGQAVARRGLDGGWTRQTLPAGTQLSAVAGVEGDLWAVGGRDSGTVPLLMRSDGGVFASAPVPSGATSLNDVFWAGTEDVWVASENGQLSHWKDGAWSYETPGPSPLLSIWGPGNGELWAVGNAPVLSHRDSDGGWSEDSYFSGSGKLSGVWGTSSKDVWACGAAGVFHFDGQSWNQAVLPYDPQVENGWFEAVRVYQSRVFVAGSDGTVLMLPLP